MSQKKLDKVLFNRAGLRRRRKVWKNIFRVFLIMALITCLETAALSQSQTGVFKGKIIDQEGQPLAAATVYLRSPSLLGIRIILTSRKGNARIPGLPPGFYKITVEKPDFKTVNLENIIVRVGKTTSLKIIMETTTIEEEVLRKIPSSTGDKESPKMAVPIEKELLTHIPLSRNIHDVLNLASGVFTDRAPYEANLAIHGSPVRANIFDFEGVTISSPADRKVLTNLNLDTIDEIELETTGHPTGVNFPEGGYINVVTRSGGNRWGGELHLLHTAESLSSKLRSEDELSKTGISPQAVDKRLWDISFSLEGSFLEDMLWFFGNARWLDQARGTSFIPWMDPQGINHDSFTLTNEEKMGFFKLSSRFIPELKVAATVYSVIRDRSIFESPVNWNQTEEATRILDHDNHLMGSGRLNYLIDRNTDIDVKAGYVNQKTLLRLPSAARKAVQYFDEATGHSWGSAGFNEDRLQRRFQVAATLTRFQESFLGANHELKVGAGYEFSSGEYGAWKAENLMIHYYDSSPYYFEQDISPVTSNLVGKGKIFFSLAGKNKSTLNPKIELRTLSFFAQDSITIANRLTILLGLRFDRSTVDHISYSKAVCGNPVSLKIGEELIEPIVGLSPYSEINVNQWRNILAWNSLSPRLGLSFDILGNGKSILKASFSRYREYLMLDYITNLIPLTASSSHQFYWFDEDSNQEVDETDTFILYPQDYRLYQGDFRDKMIASETKSPYTDEIAVGLHLEPFRDFSFRVNYIHKKKADILENVLYDPDSDRDWYTTDQDTENWWLPFETIVPGVDNYVDTPVTVYYFANNAPPLFYRMKNVPELSRKYQAVEFTFKKRMANNWQLAGSFVLSKATGNIGLDYDSSSGYSRAADSPNSFVNLPSDSRLDYDRPFVLKLMGTYRLPLNFFLSFNYVYSKGTPWARTATIIPPSSWIQANNAYSTPVKVYLEKPGERRTEPYNNLDLRVEKKFRLGQSGSLSLYADIFNVLGYKYDWIFKNDDSFWFPEDEDTTQGLQMISPNYKQITSLFGTRTLSINLRIIF